MSYLSQRALDVIPCGSQTYSRSARYYTRPLFFNRGYGGYVYDAEGKSYLDFVLGLGAVTIGHCDEKVNDAIEEQLSRGILFPQSAVCEVSLVEEICRIIPCAEMVKFVKNGSDAASSAVRLARAATGKEMMAVCGYHGMDDWYIGSTEMNNGVPQCVKDLVVKFRYNDIDSLKEVISCYDLAAVILEPIQENGPAGDYLKQVRDLCDRAKVVLVFDEVVSAFRYALGGAQELYDVKPDLCIIGKGMANGLPISAVCGKKELMKLIEKDVFVSTTFGGELVSIAAASATISILKEKLNHIHDMGNRLYAGLLEILNAKKPEGVRLVGLVPHFGYVFDDNYSASVYQQRLLDMGVISLGINNFCVAHTEEDIDRYIEIAAEGLDDVMANKPLIGNLIRTVFKR